MESHDRYKLLFIVLFLYLASHARAYRNAMDMTLSPDMAPNLQPVSSPGPASAPISSSPNLQPASSPGLASIPTANAPLNYVSYPPSASNSPSSLPSELEASAPDVSTSFIPKNVDPKVTKICDSTDHPSLCLGTVAPHLDDKTDSFSMLEVSIKASSELTKFALSMAKKLSNMPGVPPQLASVLLDCKDSYDEAMSNFEKAMNALPEHDIGTVNTMLSAVITNVGDCEDELSTSGSTFPLSNYAQKLTNMTSNCLAIASLLQD